jgi:hypothetical protein
MSSNSGFDVVAVAAFVASVSAFGFNMWQWSKRRKSEQIRTSREMMDRVLAKKQILDEYIESVENNPEMEDIGKELDKTNDVLEEIKYYGLLIKHDELQESEIVKHDRSRTYEIRRKLRFRGIDILEKMKKKGLEKQYKRMIERHQELHSLVIKYWGPDPKAENGNEAKAKMISQSEPKTKKNVYDQLTDWMNKD